MNKKWISLFCTGVVLVSVAAFAGCKAQEPEKKTESTEPPRYVDPCEELLPKVDEGYYYKDMPKAYEKESQNQGTLELLTYTSFNAEGEEVEDHAFVYLPYGYNPQDTGKKYNVFYMSHGGGGDYYSMFYKRAEWQNGKQVPTIFKNVLDNMIENKDIEPMIVVTPTYTLSSPEYYQQNCLAQCLLPAVESKYNTYAETADAAGLKASRDHRAFGGYSMGSGNCWYSFQYNLDYIKWFMPMSGAHLESAFATRPLPEICDSLEQVVSDANMTAKDFYIYSSCGPEKLDNAYEHVRDLFVELAKHTNTFVYTNDFHTGNIHVSFSPKNAHGDVPYGVYYIYNTLPLFFQNY